MGAMSSTEVHMNPTISTTQPSAQLYNLRDITELCRFSKSHLYNLIQRGQFPQPSFKNGPRFTRWTAADVNVWLADPAAWIAAHRDKAEAQA